MRKYENTAKYEKLRKYWPYCTRNSAITNAYSCQVVSVFSELIISMNMCLLFLCSSLLSLLGREITVTICQLG